MSHYGLEGRKSQSGKAHELGDVEQRHYRFKKAVDQALMLRGSRDFADRDEYAAFLRKLFSQLNAGRYERLLEEQKLLRPLSNCRLEACKRLQVKVGTASKILEKRTRLQMQKID